MIQNLNEIFAQIDSLIQRDLLDDASNQVNSLDHANTATADKLQLELYRCLILSRKDENKTGLERIEQLITSLQPNGSSTLLFDAYIVQIELFVGLNQFDNCKPVINVLKEILPTLTGLNRQEKVLREGLVSYWEGSIHLFENDASHGLNLLEYSLSLFESIDYKFGVGKCHYRLGSCFSETKELQRAAQNYEKAIAVFEQLQNKKAASPPLNNLGLIYIDLGDLNQGLTYLRLSQEIDREMGDKKQVAMSYNNIGEIYRLKGELEAALECYQHVLDMKEELGTDEIVAFSLGNTGIVHWQKGELEQARDCLEQSITFLRKMGNTKDTDEGLYYLTVISIEMNDMIRANQYMTQLQLLAKQEERNMVINQMARMTEALILRTSNKVRNRVKAEVLFEQIAYEDIVSHELTVKALIYLTELILLNLKDEGDMDDLIRMKKSTERLQEIAKKQYSHWVLVETYVLQAKLSLLEFNILDARRLLSLAQLLAEEKGLHRLAIKISLDHDMLLNQLEVFDEQEFRKLTLAERAEAVQIDSLAKRMIRKEPVSLAELTEEKPVLLLIMNSTGISLYSTFFSKEAQLNEQLIGGLLTALNAFSGEVFSNSLDRAKFGNYNIVMKPVEPIMICYLFEGPSYQASQKVDRIIQLLKENDNAWRSLANRQQELQGLSTKEKTDLELLFINVFTPK